MHMYIHISVKIRRSNSDEQTHKNKQITKQTSFFFRVSALLIELAVEVGKLRFLHHVGAHRYYLIFKRYVGGEFTQKAAFNKQHRPGRTS